jgi:hypothetical protein
MNWIVSKIKWIMIGSGAITCTMLQAVIVPDVALDSMFGDSLQGPVAEIIVRNWGALITLVGVMLIYGAFHPHLRSFVVTIAGISKIIFIGLILAFGSQYLGEQVITAIIFDSVVIALFIVYLVGNRRSGKLVS